MTQSDSAKKTRLTFAAGGWVILLALILVLGITVFAFLGPMRGEKPIGDGRDPTTYGFDLSHLSFPQESLVGSGNPRDFMRSLDGPTVLAGSEIAPRNEKERIKYAISADRVIGITVNGESRAYPLQLMNVHEIANDTLGGVPIAVTYSPLCDSAVIFNRTIKGKIVKFGVSGLLLNSNLVMYETPDAPDATTEKLPAEIYISSLWSQLAFRAIAGPAAANETQMTLMPGTQVCTWAAWFLLHPDTTIVMPNISDKQRMKETDYERYWQEGKVNFPIVSLEQIGHSDRTIPFIEIAPTVAPLLDAGMGTMAMIIAVQYPNGWKIVPLATLPKFVDIHTYMADSSMLGVRVNWRIVPQKGALVQEADPIPIMVPCRWFAWQAFHPTRAQPG
ncbi:hypothetical protein LBMAG51_01820 [Phycisphaerae bacterium]|nr:hypothetical protein LBMAG51_01820 [Phycisphaerae bacterium]